MKPKSIRRFAGFQSIRPLALVITITAFAAGSAYATTFQWTGLGTSSEWTLPENWNANGVPVSGDHRVSINCGTIATPTNDAVFNSPSTTLALGASTGLLRGLVIGSGVGAGYAKLRISAGTISTEAATIIVGNSYGDILGNTGGNSFLELDGGNYTSGASGLYMGLGGGPTSEFTINSASSTAKISTLTLNATTATVNLEAGILEVNQITGTGGTRNFNFNGGTLKARQTNPAFVTGMSAINVKDAGAIIDTNSFNVTISEALLEDPASPGGDLTKNGAGTLTLANPSTVSGDVTVSAGGLGVKASTTNSWIPATLTHSGDTLNFDLGVYNPANPPVIDVPTLTLNTTNTTVNISGSSIPVSSEIKILEYGTKSGSGSLKLNIASLPTNMMAELKENTVAGYYYLEVTLPSATSFTWSGDTNADGTGDWDTTSLNWNTNGVAYAPPALVTFPSIAGGGTVTLTADFAPISVDINNATGNPYTFAGTGKITGSTGIVKAGTGIVKFNGAAHTYSGALAINAGAVIKQVADATTGGITVAADNVSFVLDGGITEGSGQTLTISGRGATAADFFFTGSAVQRGALQAHNGASTWEGNIVLASNSTSVFNRIGVQNGASLTLTGNITESVTGAPLLFRAGLSGDNITLGGTGVYSYTGQTQIFSNGASIILGSDNKLPTTSSVFFGSGGSTVFDLNGNDQEFAGISGNAFGAAATITNNGSEPSTLTAKNPAESPTEVTDYYPGLIADGANTVSFVKNGDGTQILVANNTYTGTTTINGGRLEISENQSATGDVIINGGNLKLSNVKALSFGVNMTIASGGFFYSDGTSQTLGKLEGTGTIDHTYNAVGVDTLSVGANDQSSTFGGVIQQSQPRTYALTKIGTGTLTLTGLNTYTGNTTVEDGTLSIAQSNFADTSTVTIGSAEASAAILNLPNAGTDIVTALIIDGVSQPGDGAMYGKDNSGGAITGNGKIQVGTSPAGGYAQWVTTNNVTEGENGDDDKDGISNLVEYALGLDPKASSGPVGTFTGNTLTFTKGLEAKTADDVAYIIETSTTLEAGSWIPAAATETEDAISYLLPSSVVGGKIFGRLKVTKP